LRVIVPLLLLASSACARAADDEGEDEATPIHAPVSVDVTNQYALPVEVYAFGSGITHRLGTVHPGMDSRFVIPQNLVGGGSVRFEARPGSDARPFQSGEVLLSPGSDVQIMISPQLFNSTVTLRQ
jgi:hypothetical protein